MQEEKMPINTIENPVWLFLIFLVLIFWIKKNDHSINFSNIRIIGKNKVRSFIGKSIKYLRKILFTLVFILLSIIVAKPMIMVDESFEEREAREISLAIDVSTSMSGKGITSIKKITNEFVDKRAGDWITISAYSGNYQGNSYGAFIIRSLTPNLTMVKDSIEMLEARMFGAWTAMGDGIWSSIMGLIENDIKYTEEKFNIQLDVHEFYKAVKNRDMEYVDLFCKTIGKKKNRVLIVFTDGIYNVGMDPVLPIKIIEKLGIKLYLVVLKPSAATGVTKEEGEQRMARVKKATIDADGQYFDGESYDDIDKFFKTIDRLEKGKIFIKKQKALQDNYTYFAIISFCLFGVFLTLRSIWIKVP